jgi:hypothetical protein
MAEFTQQQKTILASTTRSNLINAIAKTGKTTLLARKYLNQQEHPGANKAIFITANALATQRVLEHLQRITALSWEEDWIGTFAEIGGKLLKRYHRELSYTKPPQIVSDHAASADREAARKTAVQLHPDTASAAFHEQWNQAFVQLLRRKNIATPRSLTIETANLFAKVVQPELAGIRLLLADNVHDFGWEELLALSALQERMAQSFFAGNSNLAIYERQQDLDPEHWLTLVNQDGIKTHPLTQLFGVGNAQGVFLQQLAAFNSKRVYESAFTCAADPNSQMLVEVTVPTRRQMLGSFWIWNQGFSSASVSAFWPSFSAIPTTPGRCLATSKSRTSCNGTNTACGIGQRCPQEESSAPRRSRRLISTRIMSCCRTA